MVACFDTVLPDSSVRECAALYCNHSEKTCTSPSITNNFLIPQTTKRTVSSLFQPFFLFSLHTHWQILSFFLLISFADLYSPWIFFTYYYTFCLFWFVPARNIYLLLCSNLLLPFLSKSTTHSCCPSGSRRILEPPYFVVLLGLYISSLPQAFLHF